MASILRFFLKSVNFFVLLILFFIGNFNGLSQTPTSFEDWSKSNKIDQPPIYHIINRVVHNNDLLLKKYYSKNQWGRGNVGNAWAKIRSYFPKKFYSTSSTTYFMTHQFTEGGGKQITVFASNEGKEAAQNFNNYNSSSIVEYYNEIKKEKNNDAINEFKEKLGLLESYFENENKHGLLKSYLGSRLYNQLLESLRAEGDHIFAAAMVHEGMHATIGTAHKANKINNDFKKCKTPVQWDELRGYMSEMQYHFNYAKFSRDKINAHMASINKLLDELDKLRKFKKPPNGPLKKSERNRIEKIKAKIKAHIAMIRVSLREMKQSLDRMKSMIDFFKKQKYVKDTAPKEYHDLVKNIEAKIQKFTNELMQSIAAYEKGLRDLEKMLNAWNDWAKCVKKDPPAEEEHKKTKKEFEDVTWPTPPTTDDEKNIAERKLAVSYNLGPYAVDSSQEELDNELLIEDLSEPSNIPDAETSKETILVRSGVEFINPKMNALNSYFNYLNDTWTRDVGAIDSSTGFWIQASYHTSDHFSIGLDYANHSMTRNHAISNYSSDITLNALTFAGTYNSAISPSLMLNLSGGIGFNSAEYSETEGSFNVNGTSTDLGFQVSGGMDLRIASSFGITTEVGYRTAKLSGFSDEIHFFNASNTAVELDFSGVFTRIGLQFKF